MAEMPKPDLRQHLAAERTILAQVRTAVAMITMGFVIARFGLLVRELRILGREDIPANPISHWFGTLMVLAGAIFGLVAAVHYRAIVRRLNDVMDLQERPSGATLAFCWILFVSGLFMAVYLLMTN
jgi:putative membrane protein